MKLSRLLPALVLIALLAAAALWLRTTDEAAPLSRAWGSVDTRQVSLAFEASGRIAEMPVDEGMPVRAGDVLGRLDTTALEISREEARARLEDAQAQASLAREGSRAEDIAAARAKAAALESRLELARRTAARQRNLVSASASSRQNLDDARFAAESAERELAASRAELAKLEAGLRPQEIASAEAALCAARAQLAALDYQIARASILVAPADGIVRTRLAEPGDMAGPSRTTLQLSVVSPKRIRVWVTERQLGLVREGAQALVTTDTTGPLKARVRWISSTAEFTPKTVQTAELRAALVYEVRLEIEDAENRLRLGQPVTVDFIDAVGGDEKAEGAERAERTERTREDHA